MSTKKLVTRIQNKYDSLSNWALDSIKLLPGEIAFIKVIDQKTDPATGEILHVPAILMKVGEADENGELKSFNELPWLSAKASDVYDWAKKPEKPSYTLEELGGGRVNGIATLDAEGKIPTSQIPADIVNHKQLQADFAQNDSSKIDYIKNKPIKVSDFNNDAKYQTEAQLQAAIAGFQTAQQISDTLTNYPTFQQMNNTLTGKSDIGHIHNIAELNGVADIEHGGTGYSTIVDTVYTTARYRASSLHSSETTPSINGTITWQYE